MRDLRIVRALRAHEHRTAASLLAAFVFAYLWPVLVGGRTLAPTAALYQLTPWKASAPGTAGLINNELGDVMMLYYPWDVLARQLIHAGTFPAWNPYALAGTPFFANFQVAWLSPFSVPLWVLPLNYGLGVAAALKLWLAGFGTYLLARELRLGFWPGMLAAVSFALCAFNVVWLTHGVFVSVACMLPWAIWLTERTVRHGRSRDALALAAVAGVVQTGGHPGTQVHVLAAVVLYAVVRTIATAGTARREQLRRAGLLAAALGIGTLLAAVVLLPAQRASVDTIGVLLRRNGSPSFPGASMPWHVIRTALFPEWWGRPSETTFAAPANFRERTFYAGAATLVLALVALVSPGGWRRKAPFALLAALGLAIAVHTPLHRLAVHLPLFDQVQDQRILLWFVFAIPLLAGFGLQAVIDHPRRWRIWAVVGVALLAGVVAAAGTGVEGETAKEALHYFLNRSDATYAAAAALASAGWWVAIVLALAAALALARRRHARVGLVGALVVLVAALDVLHFAHGYQKMTPTSIVVPPVPPSARFLQQHAADGRFATVGQALLADFPTVYGLRDVRGADVPQPSTRYAALWQSMGGTHETETIEQVTSKAPAVLGILGARYLLTGPEEPVSVPSLQPVYQGADATIYENALAVPRAFVASRVRVAADGRGELAAVTGASFVPRRDAVVRRDDLAGEQPPQGAGTVRVVGEANASVTLTATLARRSLVVLDDAWVPGWSVRIDGAPARVLRTDIALRGTIVPAGRHRIVWTYRIPGLRAGAALSAAGLLAFLAWAAWLLARRRRRLRG